MKGRTNVGGGGSGGGDGDIIEAVNKTGSPIFKGQKVWVNKDAAVANDFKTDPHSKPTYHYGYMRSDGKEFHLANYTYVFTGVNDFVKMGHGRDKNRNYFLDDWYIEDNSDNLINYKTGKTITPDSLVGNQWNIFPNRNSKVFTFGGINDNKVIYEIDEDNHIIDSFAYTNTSHQFEDVSTFRKGDYIYDFYRGASGKINRETKSIELNENLSVLGDDANLQYDVCGCTPDEKYFFIGSRLRRCNDLMGFVRIVEDGLGVYFSTQNVYEPDVAVWFEGRKDSYVSWFNPCNGTGIVMDGGEGSYGNVTAETPEEAAKQFVEFMQNISIIKYEKGKFVKVPFVLEDTYTLTEAIKQQLEQYNSKSFSLIDDDGHINIMISPDLSYFVVLLVASNVMPIIYFLDRVLENGCYVYHQSRFNEGTLIGKALEDAEPGVNLKVATVLADNTMLTVTANIDNAEITLE